MELTETYTLTQEAFVNPNIRYIIQQGGSSSGKTYSTMQLLYLFGKRNNKPDLISIVSENLPHLKRGCIRDIKNILATDGLWSDKDYNKSEQILKVDNKIIEFFGADSPSKLHGGRRDYLYINEANNISYDAYTQLDIRTRKKVIIDYNPTKEFWANDLIGRPDVAFIKTTYKNNDQLEPQIIDSIERRKYNKNDLRAAAKLQHQLEIAQESGDIKSIRAINNKLYELITEWYKVYGMGEVGSLEGVVYTDWSQCDEFPWDANKIYGFIDFGFTNDPAAVGVAGVYDGEIYTKEYIYETGLRNKQLYQKICDLELNHLTFIVESSEPKSISDLKSYGLKVIPAKKPKGSINFGIELLQEYHINVTKDSLNAVKELRGYQWVKDKATGKYTNTPVDDDNHYLDALRYWALRNLDKTVKTTTSAFPGYF